MEQFSVAGPTENKMAENSIPMFILVDEGCGSAGERAMNLLKNVDNSIVIGSYTCGAQLGGNAVETRLPNSGIQCRIGTQLSFVNKVENVDLKGYAPDIWCNPKNALDTVLKMLQSYGLVNDADVFAEQIEATQATPEVVNVVEPGPGSASSSVKILYEGIMVPPESGFGTNVGTHSFYVYKDGEKTTDYLGWWIFQVCHLRLVNRSCLW